MDPRPDLDDFRIDETTDPHSDLLEAVDLLREQVASMETRIEQALRQAPPAAVDSAPAPPTDAERVRREVDDLLRRYERASSRRIRRPHQSSQRAPQRSPGLRPAEGDSLRKALMMMVLAELF